MKNFFRILDKKQYELKDHLGNVRVAIGDMKVPTLINGQIRFYVDEKSVSDFYPGGMSISDRSWQGTSYRYGYNAQEKSLEIDASGNHHTAEFWEVNNSSMKRWNTDPVVKPHESGYAIFSGNPLFNKDPYGNDSYGYGGTDQNPNDFETNKGLKDGTRDIVEFKSSKKDKQNEAFTMIPWKNDFDNAINAENRQKEAERISEIIINKHDENHSNEDITLLGYSFGGDVAMRTAIILNEHYQGKVTIKVVSLSTPLDPEIVTKIYSLKSVSIEHTFIENDATVLGASIRIPGLTSNMFKGLEGTFGNFTQHKITTEQLKVEKTITSYNQLKFYGTKQINPFSFFSNLPNIEIEDNHGWIYYRPIVNIIYPKR